MKDSADESRGARILVEITQGIEVRVIWNVPEG